MPGMGPLIVPTPAPLRIPHHCASRTTAGPGAPIPGHSRRDHGLAGAPARTRPRLTPMVWGVRGGWGHWGNCAGNEATLPAEKGAAAAVTEPLPEPFGDLAFDQVRGEQAGR